MCAKHNITKDLVVSSVGNCCLWFATDYACDEKGKLVQFYARFETEEQSVEFLKIMEQAQSTLEKVAQQWPCDSCNVKNKTEAAKGIVCDTVKPEAVITVSSPPIPSTTSTTGMLLSSFLPKAPSPEFTTTQVSFLLSLMRFFRISCLPSPFFYRVYTELELLSLHPTLSLLMRPKGKRPARAQHLP